VAEVIMRIGELAVRTGVSVRSLRCHEVIAVSHPDSGYRFQPGP
jgi:DNA-binding transcriptional MerR regulator